MKLKHWLSLSIIVQIVFVVSMVELFDVCMIALVILCAYFCIFSKEKIRGGEAFCHLPGLCLANWFHALIKICRSESGGCLCKSINRP